MADLLEAHVSESDAFTIQLERDPLLRSTIVAVAILDRAPDRAVLLDRIDRATRLAPTFREKLVRSPLRLAPPRWVVDPDFDLSWHVRNARIPARGGMAAVREFARTAGMTAFDPERPLWEFTVLEGLPKGRAALVMKVHHALTDGIGLVRAVPGATRAVRSDPIGTATTVGATARSIFRFVRPVTDTRSPVMTDRRLQWHYDDFDVPLADLKAAGATVGGTMNDAFVAGIAGGLRRYHHALDAPVDLLRITMPISIRTADDGLGGNHITLVRFEAPVGVEHPGERMRVVHDQCRSLRHEAAIPYSNQIAAVLNLLPVRVTGGMLKHVDLLASNVPGFPEAVYVGGARLDAFYAYGPTIGSAANITLMSYRGTCHIGVTTDTGAVPDPDHLTACLQAGFAEVVATATGSA